MKGVRRKARDAILQLDHVGRFDSKPRQAREAQEETRNEREKGDKQGDMNKGMQGRQGTEFGNQSCFAAPQSIYGDKRVDQKNKQAS